MSKKFIVRSMQGEEKFVFAWLAALTITVAVPNADALAGEPADISIAEEDPVSTEDTEIIDEGRCGDTVSLVTEIRVLPALFPECTQKL